ncbi:MAG: hypothetical protein AAGE86_11630, partial [Pseudomonadota bacterium]
MDYKTWKSETYGGIFKPRSKTLKIVDTAFERCRNSVTGPLRRREALFVRLLDWIDLKGTRWRRSVRNSKKDIRGLGAVERLVETFAADMHFLPRLVDRGLAAPPAAPARVPVYRPRPPVTPPPPPAPPPAA